MYTSNWLFPHVFMLKCLYKINLKCYKFTNIIIGLSMICVNTVILIFITCIDILR